MSMILLVVVMLLCILSFSLYELVQVGKGAQGLVSHTAYRLEQSQKIQFYFSSSIKELRGFLLYGTPKYEQGSREELGKSLEIMKAYNSTTTIAEVKEEGVKLEKLLIEYQSLLEGVIKAKKENSPNLNEILIQGRKQTIVVEKQTIVLENLQKKYLTSIGAKLFEQSEKMTNIAIFASLFTTIITLGYGYWNSKVLVRRLDVVRKNLMEIGHLNLTGQNLVVKRNDEIGDMALTINSMRVALREFIEKIGQTSQELSNSSVDLSNVVDEQLQAVESVAESAMQIARGASNNAENIRDISATLQEISASSQEAAASSSQVNHGTTTAVEEAVRGMELLDNVVRQNEYMEQAMSGINQVTENLAQGSEKIKGIISVISAIAGQTNLLALNAAIEAARAGEAGRGFAVVADEVRKLAEESNRATTDIIGIINSMGEEIQVAVVTVGKANQEVNRGKEAAASTKQGFDAILDKLKGVNVGISQIAETVDEMAKGTQGMVGNVENINEVAEKTSTNCEMVAVSAEQQNARMREISSSAEKLEDMADTLKLVVGQFKV